MNDDFLKHYRKPPRRAFSDALARKLNLNPPHSAQKGIKTMRFISTYLAVAAALLLALTTVLMPESAPPSLTQIDTSNVIDDLTTLSTENVADIQEVAQIGAGTINNADWSPDGTKLAVFGTLGAYLYDADLSSDPVLFPSSSTEYYQSGIDFHPDSQQLAVVDGRTIRVWDTESRTQTITIDTGDLYATALTFSHDGQYLAAALSTAWSVSTMRSSVMVWAWETGELVAQYDSPHDVITAIAFSADDTSVFFNDSDEVIEFPISDTSASPRSIQTGDRLGGNGMAISPDGQLIAAAAGDGAGIWNLETRQRVATIGIALPGYTNAPPFVTDLAFTADSSALIISSLNAGVRVWDIEAGEFTSTRFGGDEGAYPNSNGISIHPDGNRFALIRADSEIELWTLDGERIAHRADVGERIYNMALNADGETLAVSGFMGHIDVWNLRTGHRDTRIEAGDDYIPTFAFSPDGSLMVLPYTLEGKSSPNLVLYDHESGEVVRTLPHYPFSAFDVRSLVFSPDGTKLYGVHGANSWVQMWDLTTSEDAPDDEQLSVAYRPGFRIGSALGISPDGALLAVAFTNMEQPTLVDMVTGDTFRLPGMNDVSAFAFSPDGTQIAAINSNQMLIVWEVATRDQVFQQQNGGSYFYDLAYSPDSSLVITSSNTAIQIWDAQTGELLHETEPTNVNQVAFSPNGEYIVSGGWDGLIRVWGVEAE